jgi:hypothetical protein
MDENRMKVLRRRIGAIGATSAAIGATAALAAGPSPIDGTYRIRWSEQELIAAGTTRSYAQGNEGVLTWKLHDGTFTLDFMKPPLCHGSYAVARNNVSINQGPHGCHGRVTATWSLRNGLLRLHVTRATDPGDTILFGAKSWKKIA